MTDNSAVHMRHCNQGEWVGLCKYGDDNYPAMTDPATQNALVREAEAQPTTTAGLERNKPRFHSQFPMCARKVRPDWACDCGQTAAIIAIETQARANALKEGGMTTEEPETTEARELNKAALRLYGLQSTQWRHARTCSYERGGRDCDCGLDDLPTSLLEIQAEARADAFKETRKAKL